jgi:hypothetical protein
MATTKIAFEGKTTTKLLLEGIYKFGQWVLRLARWFNIHLITKSADRDRPGRPWEFSWNSQQCFLVLVINVSQSKIDFGLLHYLWPVHVHQRGARREVCVRLFGGIPSNNIGFLGGFLHPGKFLYKSVT